MKTTRILLAALAAAFLSSACGGAATSGPEPANPPTGPQPPVADQPAPPAAEAPVPPTLRLPDGAAPLAYILNFTLDPSKPTFSGDARINLELTQPTDHLWLNGTELQITSATLKTDSESLAATPIAAKSEQFIGFTFPKQVGPGKVWLEIAYTGKVSDKNFSGLFHQQDGPEGHKDWYLYSQFEAIGARKAYPSFDEPKWKVPFTVSLTVPKDLSAFSNTSQKSVMAAADGMKTVVFQTTKPIPSYLLALAVGPFEVVDVGPVGRGKTPVRIISTKGNTGKVAFAKKAIVESLTRLEDYFDLAYPYPKLDHIMLPHFLGAMENPGLITYDEGILLAEPGKESRGFMRSSADTIAHETAHQWFGDLVTLAWWNDTWLNESFATWMAAKIINEWHPEWEGLTSAVAMRSRVMGRDSLITSSKIRHPIENESDIAGAFDSGITYGKGSAVLWMFEQAIGPNKFQQGVREYIRAHSWQTATADDFLASIAKVSDPVIPAAFRTFLDQPGVPVVSAALTCQKGAAPSLALSQKRYLPTGSKGSTDQTWSIPVCVEYPAGKKVARTCTMLSKKQDALALDQAKRCPTWVLANADAAGYYRVAYQGDLLKNLLTKGKKKLSIAERVNVIDDLDALVASNEVDLGEAMAVLPSLAREKNRYIVESGIGIIGALNDWLVPEKLRANRARFIRKTFGAAARRLGWSAKKGESDDTKTLRSRVLPLVADKGEDKKLRKQALALTKKWLKTGKGIDDDDLGEVMGTAAIDGDMALRDAILAKGLAETDRHRRGSLLGAVGAFRDPEIVKANLKLFLENKDLGMREAFALLGGSMASPDNREMVYQFIKDNHEAIMNKLPQMARGYIVGIGGAFCDQKHYDDLDNYFRPIAKKELQGEKILDQTLEQMQLCMAFKKAQQPKVEAFLKKQ